MNIHGLQSITGLALYLTEAENKKKHPTTANHIHRKKTQKQPPTKKTVPVRIYKWE